MYILHTRTNLSTSENRLIMFTSDPWTLTPSRT